MSDFLNRGILLTGLILLLAVSVQSSDVTRIGRTQIPKINPDADRYDYILEIPRNIPSNFRPDETIQIVPGVEFASPPDPYCDLINYSGEANNAFRINGAGYDYYNMRFDSDAGTLCSLLTAYIGLYPDGFIGQPDMEVVVWADDGLGYPGIELGRVYVPFVDLPESMGNVAVDLSLISSDGALIFSGGEQYHIGITCPNAVENVTELVFLIDDGTQGSLRSSRFYNGQWIFQFDNTGSDRNYLFSVDVCCDPVPYSDCFRQSYDIGIDTYWRQPNQFGDDYYNMRMSAVHGVDTLTGVGLTLYEAQSDGTPDLDIFIWGSLAGFPDLSNVIYQTTVAYEDIAWLPEYIHVDMKNENIIVNSDFHVGWSTNEASDPNGVLAGFSDNGQYGSGRSSFCIEPGDCSWSSMYDIYGRDVNFQIYADVCAISDPDICPTEYDYCNVSDYWRLPDRYGDNGSFQKMSGGVNASRLERVRLSLYNYGGANCFSQNSEVQVYLADGPDGLPGTKLGGVVLTPADYVTYPGMTEVDFSSLDITFLGNIWVGIESFANRHAGGNRDLVG